MKNIISFLCIFVVSLFLNTYECLADEIGSELNKNFSIESKSNDGQNVINDKVDNPKANNEDIFGDEQTFPFIAGLGKNAAH